MVTLQIHSNDHYWCTYSAHSHSQGVT